MNPSASDAPYLQNGQQPPLAVTVVAAAAVVPNTASTSAINPTSFPFIGYPSRLKQSGPSVCPRLHGKA